MAGFEIVEHTADVGVRARAESLEETFRQATLGLLDITGAYDPRPDGEEITISVEAHDLGALLVDWLSEVLYLQDARDAVILQVEVGTVVDNRAEGHVRVATRGEHSLEGTAVKAVTYHQLTVEEWEGGWFAQVFLDI